MKNKVYEILLCVLLVVTSISTKAQWITQSGHTNFELNSVYFTSASTGYIVGDGHIILKTTNGGSSWMDIADSAIFEDLESVFFVNSTTGYAVGFDGANGMILKTTNAGVNWNLQNGGSNILLTDISFADANNGIAVGFNYLAPIPVILITSNGGTNWISKTSPCILAPTSVCFGDANTAYIVSYSDTLLKSTNCGNNWTQSILSTGGGYAILSVYFTDVNTGYAVGSQDYVLKTTDGGVNWSPIPSGTTNTLTSVYFPSATTGYAVGYQGTIIKTTDSGSTWTTLVSNTSKQLNAVFFTDVNTGYVVGTSGTILKTTNGGVAWIKEMNTNVEMNISPNPATDVLNVSIDKVMEGNICISNSLGEIVMKKRLKDLNTEINIAGLPKGVYFINVSTDCWSENRKIIKN